MKTNRQEGDVFVETVEKARSAMSFFSIKK